MIDLSLTKEQMLKGIGASHNAFVNRFSDPLSPDLLSLDEASLVIRRTTPDQLWPVLNALMSKRFAQVPTERLFSDLMYPVKKGLGNAYKWGNNRDTAKDITVEAVVTKAGAVLSISDEGDGFDAEGRLSSIRRSEQYFIHGGSGFRHFAKTRSLISYANGGRTLLIRYRCAPDVGEAGFDRRDVATETRLATAMRVARARVCLVSYPMSGGMRLRALIGKALCEKYGLDERLIFREPRLTKSAGVLRTMCTNGDAEVTEDKHYKDLQTNLARYHSKRIILLIRDPRDLVVSCYLYATGPKGTYRGSLSDFVRSDHHGIRRIVTFYRIWHANRHVPEMLLPIGYDVLRSDPGGTLRRALALIDAQEYGDEIISRAVDYCHGRCTRKREGAASLADGATLKPDDDSDQEWYEDGPAQVGCYMRYLNREDQEYVNGVIEALGEPPFITPRVSASRTALPEACDGLNI
jgi:hypothetical protein